MCAIQQVIYSQVYYELSQLESVFFQAKFQQFSIHFVFNWGIRCGLEVSRSTVLFQHKTSLASSHWESLFLYILPIMWVKLSKFFLSPQNTFQSKWEVYKIEKNGTTRLVRDRKSKRVAHARSAQARSGKEERSGSNSPLCLKKLVIFKLKSFESWWSLWFYNSQSHYEVPDLFSPLRGSWSSLPDSASWSPTMSTELRHAYKT